MGADPENTTDTTNCCDNRTRCEKLLIVLFLLMTAAAVTLTYWVALGSKIHGSHPSGNDGLCQTPDCVHLSSQILQSLDTSINPCDDFYEFACGGFLSGQTIPDGKVSLSPKTARRNQIHQQLREILEAEMPDVEPRPFRLAQRFYKSCMNEDWVEKSSKTSITNFFSNFGGWPVLQPNHNQEKLSHLVPLLAATNKLGRNYLFNVFIGPDAKNSRFHALYIGNPDLEISHHDLIQGMGNHNVRAYFDQMVQIVDMFGSNYDVAISEMRDVMLFMISLGHVTYNLETLSNYTDKYVSTSIKELEKNYGYISWTNFFKHMFPLNTGITIGDTEKIIVENLDYLKELKKLFVKTPLRTIINYIMIRTIIDVAPYLTNDIIEIRRTYFESTTGARAFEPRWELCVQEVEKGLSLSVAAMYIRKHFDLPSKESAENLFNEIRDQFATNFANADWMDDRTKQFTIIKLKSITNRIGFSDDLLNDKWVDDFYLGLDFKENEYFESFTRLKNFQWNKFVRRYRHHYNKTDWMTTRIDSSGHDVEYHQTDNSVEVPWESLIGDYRLAGDLPKFLLYGDVATMMGRVIAEGVNEEGRYYDRNGELRDWWSRSTKDENSLRSMCFIDQLNEFVDPLTVKNLDGVILSDSYMTDIGGTFSAYDAYIEWIGNNDEDFGLVALEYSPNQLFWITFGQSLCEKIRPEVMTGHIKQTSTPNRFIVNGVAINNENFAKDFECDIGMAMSPLERCPLWQNV